ncbi:hypothetical protein AS9A_P20043 (plasmid) [Hoyosella subflava DQS3-9A1]|uniref:Uncharacterized protein n=1 Tax=Hoyosella subflava (strain DSM 45089 / JCM 17490 / NBRC 109087 / DQS3-9A1) TaxID=443218 RepID=F6ESG6_HOYSD|nr:hypothetical protein AS9A_P20043 [Hoyosella subflava DQS3-9A1]
MVTKPRNPMMEIQPGFCVPHNDPVPAARLDVTFTQAGVR